MTEIQPKKILIVQTAFMGDVVLATALVEKWHVYYPECQIDFLLRKGNEGILENNPHITNILIWNKKQDKYTGLLRLILKIRKIKYDVIINVQRFGTSGFLTALSKAKLKIGFKKNPFSIFFTERHLHQINTTNNEHEVKRNQRLIEKYTDENPAKPKIYISDVTQRNVNKYKQNPYICIAPGSVWFTKTFPINKWLEFINQVPENFQIYLLGSNNEKGLCEKIISINTHKKVINLAGSLSINSTAALMKDSYMNYVNDSAPLHFCSAVDANVTAIFCSTVPAFGFGPLSTKSFIIQVDEKLECRPCGLHGFKYCPAKHFNCANNIPVSKLLQTLNH